MTDKSTMSIHVHKYRPTVACVDPDLTHATITG